MLSDDSTASEHEKKTPTTFVIERKPVNGQPPPESMATQPVDGQHRLGKSTEEESKAPISDSRWVAFRRCLLVLAPIPVTAALVTLYFVPHAVYLSAEEGYINEVMKALALPNSLYSLLIVGSVSAIALHRIQYELTERDGVALGYLLAGYQLSSLTTLLSKEFWTSSYPKNRGNSRLQHLSFVGLVSLCMFLVHFCPSMGTVLLIPEPGWWEVYPKQTNLSMLVSSGNPSLFFTQNVPWFSSRGSHFLSNYHSSTYC
jgi:hypothetical protein